MSLSPRDLALLQLLDRTPATALHIRKASISFPEDSFLSDRRVRERMQTLRKLKLVSSFSLGVSGGGLANYYKLAPEGYRIVHGVEAELPHRSFFAELSPSRLMHTLELADIIVHSLAAAHTHRIKITGFHRENELLLEIGHHRTSPDCHMQFITGGKTFNVLFELDRSTETLEGTALNSIRSKLLAYEAYQDYAYALWKQDGRKGSRPYFRVIFLTASVERAYHILALARECGRNPGRHLCYAATLDQFLAESNALLSPIFLDHRGHWQALINVYPSAPFMREPVRIPSLVQTILPL